MTTELQIRRPSRLADAVWPYQVRLDREDVSRIRNGEDIRLSIAPGTHTLEIRSLHVVGRRLGLGSPVVTFEVTEDGPATFVCHPPPFARAPASWLRCLRGDRHGWIVLERE